jgi:hypothetical protein
MLTQHISCNLELPPSFENTSLADKAEILSVKHTIPAVFAVLRYSMYFGLFLTTMKVSSA